MIVHRILAPFDLGINVSEKSFDSNKLKKNNFTIHGDLYLLPSDWHIFFSSDIPHINSGVANVFVSSTGFGCIIIDYISQNELNDQNTARILLERRTRHIEFNQANPQTERIILALRSCLISPSSSGGRKSLWHPHPYCLGLFFVAAPAIKPPNYAKCLAALCEPSIVDCEDTSCLVRNYTDEEVTQKINALDDDTVNATLKDVDISPNSESFISWASVVFVIENNSLYERTLDEISRLEARLQIGWTITHYINQWKKNALSLKQSKKDVALLKWEMHRMLEATDDIIDASLGTRLKKIYEEFILTSGFHQERRRAEKGIELCDEYLSILAAKEERKYRIIVETLLFIFGFCQVVPLIFEVPIFTLNHWLLIPTTILFICLVTIRYSKQK